jgi:hypothetical protein
MLPRRKPSQLGQLQFHCGKPPPAEDPKTRMRMCLTQAAQVIKKAHGRANTGALCPDSLNQRLAMYIVISKPKRMSVKEGVVHCIVGVSWWLA